MSRTLLSLFCSLALTTLLTTTVWAASLTDVIRTLETPFQSETPADERIQDYSGDFFQEAEIASLERMQRARGRVMVRFDYQRDGRVPWVMFRWEYDQPTTQEIVSNGENLWVYLPENNQVIRSDIEQSSQARENDPMTFLTGLGNLSRDFLITWAEPNTDIEGNYVLDLRPRRSSQLITRLIIVVDRMAVEAKLKSGQPKDPAIPQQPRRRFDDKPFGSGVDGLYFPILSTTLYDPNGNSTLIEFSDLRVNMGLPASSFDFILPGGVEVVRPGEVGLGY
jgi:outer membrane lipoprotein carrier protein